MKFITEDDLRDLYKFKPFTEYVLDSGARITPGARQFLMDKGINIFDDTVFNKDKNEVCKPFAALIQKPQVNENTKLISRMKSVEALFFLTEQELLSIDIYLAQSVIALGKQFTCIKNAVKNNATIEDLHFKDCSGMNKDNYSLELDECFEITEFHIQLEKSKEIVLLHRLRCSLCEMIAAIQDLYEAENSQRDYVIGKINQVINSLSQLICSAYGGKKCLRQN